MKSLPAVSFVDHGRALVGWVANAHVPDSRQMRVKVPEYREMRVNSAKYAPSVYGRRADGANLAPGKRYSDPAPSRRVAKVPRFHHGSAAMAC